MPTTDHRPYRTRTSVLFAAAAERAVILRRGPRTHFHLIAWDLRDDTFEHGQWMRGHVRLADLSPDGDKLLYVAEQYGRPHRTAHRVPAPQQRSRPNRRVPRYLRTASPRRVTDGWTAISTPPYFSALALWPSIGRWTGGGVFTAERSVVLRETEDGLTPIENVAMPPGWRVTAWPWADAPQPSAHAPTVSESAQHAAVADALLASGLSWVDWVDLRGDDELVFAGDGGVFRLRDWRSAPADRLLALADQLLELRGIAFEQLPAPAAAMRW